MFKFQCCLPSILRNEVALHQMNQVKGILHKHIPGKRTSLASLPHFPI